MAVSETIPKRGALYYPYIHINNENWLKATLLCFRQVRRIVPNRFTTRDYSTIEPYASLDGPDGALLDQADIHAPAVHDAQRALKSKIKENFDQIERRFKRINTPPEYQSGPASVQIHRGKLLEDYNEPGLAKLLEENDLAWRAVGKWDEDWDRDEWLTMHPRLAAAVMSTLALAVEKNEGLHIVTPSARAHNTLLANHEEQVFEALLEIPTARAEGDLGDRVDELVQIVITTGFDLTRLTPQDIKMLIDDGADLQQFRNAVATFVQEIPPGMGPEHRQRAMERQADAVLAQWNDYQNLLSPSIRQSMREVAIDRIAENINEKLLAGLGVGVGAAAMHLLGALPGFAISLVVVTGVGAYRKRRAHPMQFLNRIQRAADRSFGSLYVPQWTALASAD